MGKKFIDLTSQRFGDWTVLSFDSFYNHQSHWLCRCKCGQERVVGGGNLKSGKSQKCRECWQSDQFVNLAGQKFGKWTVIECIGKDAGGRSLWLCQCECGVNQKITCTNLTLGKSSSCRSCAKVINAGLAALNVIYHSYSKGARDRNLDFDLTHNEFRALTSSNCFYCGKEPSQISAPKECNGPYIYNGIDRLDNNLGYTPDNCVPCCKTCNRAKHAMLLEDWLEWMERLSIYQVNKNPHYLEKLL